jgi:putative acetyltransferase
VHFIAARVDGVYRACGAVKHVDDYCEIKSMFTDPDARGLGLADRILTQLETISHDLDARFTRLETGVGLDAAHRLYHRHGFVNCGPFGDYTASPYSIFMEKHLR